jgi:hypothetical protein
LLYSQEGDLFLWEGEEDEKVGMGPVDFCKLIPTLLPNWKRYLPEGSFWAVF